MKNRPERLGVTYEIDDGYGGLARTQHVAIDHSEIHECEDVESAMEMIERYIQEDFQQKSNPVYDLDEIRAKVEEIWNERPKDE